jgi:hypothetical protein
VKKMCHLGFFKTSYDVDFILSFSSKSLMEKGRKSWFKINTKKTLGLNNPCVILEKLFDTLISPIVLHVCGCEVWGVNCSYRDIYPFEHLHLKFIKEIFGIHCTAINVASLAELNRHPLKVKVKILAIKFWEHITNSNNTVTVVNKIYNNVNPNNT